MTRFAITRLLKCDLRCKANEEMAPTEGLIRGQSVGNGDSFVRAENFLQRTKGEMSQNIELQIHQRDTHGCLR